jgi:hypothetical protein
LNHASDKVYKKVKVQRRSEERRPSKKEMASFKQSDENALPPYKRDGFFKPRGHKPLKEGGQQLNRSILWKT